MHFSVPCPTVARMPSADPSRVGCQPVGARWPAGVQAAWTYREGGVSVGPWSSFNLGDHVGDDPLAVASNRQRLATACGVRPVFLRQVHGSAVCRLQPDTPDGVQADACWTDQAGLACTVLVADCLPILFAAPGGASVAAAHAGWRGLAGRQGHGVLEALCEQWPAVQRPADRSRTTVWLGPCIGPRQFEVGEDVRQAFLSSDAASVAHFVPRAPTPTGPDRYLADLPALARRRLMRLGFTVIDGNDGSAAWCTVSQPSWFFSHRRDTARLGGSGRMAALIWRRP